MKKLAWAFALLLPATAGLSSSVGEGHISKAHTNKGHIGGKTAITPLRPEDPLYLPGGMPTFDLPLAQNKDLTDAVSGKTSLVTFSRSAAQSPGTYVGADGLIHDAAVNLALYSEQFDNAYWTKQSSVILANQTTAPDGKQTADKTVPNPATGYGVHAAFASYPSGVYTASVYAKADGQNYLQFLFSSALTTEYVNFDLASGIVSDGNYVSAQIQDHGNGWRRCSVTISFASATGGFFITPITEAGSAKGAGTTTGDGTSGIYLWGAQLEKTDPATMEPTAYIHTTSQALAAPRFDHDPVTGESLGLLVEEQRANLFLNSATLATQTVTTTAAEHTLSFYGTGTVDLTGTHTATVVGTGAYPARTTLTFTPTAGSLTATVTGTVEFAQLEAGSFPTSYIPTTGTSQTRYADIAAVQDEDFSTTNLLAYSESFDVGWYSAGITFTPNDIVSPDGQQTADKLAISSSDTFGQQLTVAAGTTMTYTVHIKRGNNQWVRFGVWDSSGGVPSGANQFRAWVDLQNAELGTVSAIGSASVVGASIEDVGDGWLKVSITGRITSTSTIAPIVVTANADNSATRVSGVEYYLWGASLTATEYPVAYTTTRNLLTDSQDFERSVWNKLSGLTVYNDVAQAPDGTLTADEVQFVSTSNRLTRLSGSFPTVQSGKDYVQSIWMRSKSGTFRLKLSRTDTVTWATATVSPEITLTETWQRYDISFTAASTGNSDFVIGSENKTPYTLPATGSIYVWAAQLEPGTTATDYVRTVDVVGKRYGWYEPTEGTVYGIQSRAANTDNAVFAMLYDGTSSNRIELRSYQAGNARFLIVSGGSTQMDQGLGGPVNPIGSPNYHALSYKYNDSNVSINGNIGTQDTSVVVPIVDRLELRKATFAVEYNGHIKRLTYWPTRQADSTLQVITQ